MVEEETLIEATMEMISAILEEDGLSRTELAKRLGRSKGYVSQILSGDRNMTLRTLAQVMFALDSRAKIKVEPLSAKTTYLAGSGRWNQYVGTAGKSRVWMAPPRVQPEECMSLVKLRALEGVFGGKGIGQVGRGFPTAEEKLGTRARAHENSRYRKAVV